MVVRLVAYAVVVVVCAALAALGARGAYQLPEPEPHVQRFPLPPPCPPCKPITERNKV